MTYGINEKVFIIGLFVIFVTVILGGVFGVELARLYCKCKRIEKEYELERRERDKDERWEHEAARWMELNSKQNARIDRINEELVRTTKELERTKQILAKTNLKGETI